ncbi:MAG: hypothetical protein Q9191_007403 [Dirinaria sp. TL-2023a]
MHHRAICLFRQGSQFGVSPSTILVIHRPRVSTLWLGSRKKYSRNLHLSTGEDGLIEPDEAIPPSIGGVVVSADAHTGDDHSESQWTEDVNVNDLKATLEAHRATNRAVKIRRVLMKEPSISTRPLISIKEAKPGTKESDTGNRVDLQKAAPKVKLATTSTSKSASETTGDGDKSTSKSWKTNWVKSHWPADSFQVLTLTGQRHHAKAHEVLEYKACWLPPQTQFSIEERAPQRPYLALVAAVESKTNIGGSLQRFVHNTILSDLEQWLTMSSLHDELKAYEAYMRHSKIEEEASRILVSDVRGLIAEQFRHNPLLIIGSCRTGLADRLSDIDLALTFPDIEKKPLDRGPSSLSKKRRRLLKRVLRAVHRILSNSKVFERDTELIHARIPIVRVTHTATGLRVEIQTLVSSSIVQEYVASYLAEYPTLRTLYLVFRSALHIRGLTNVRLGGLGSYPILIMIVNALKHASGQFASDDLANQFLYILDFYGNADLYMHGFSPDPPRQFLKRKEGRKMTAGQKEMRMQDPMLRGIDIMKTYDAKKPYLLCLQDPADPTNDLGKKAYGIKHVQEMFRQFSRQLRDQMETWDEGKERSPYGLLGNFLEADYFKLDYQRRRMRGWVIKREPSLAAMLDAQFPLTECKLFSKAKRAIKRDKQITDDRLASAGNEEDPTESPNQDNQQTPGKIAADESEKEELQAAQPPTKDSENSTSPQNSTSPPNQDSYETPGKIASDESGKEELEATRPPTTKPETSISQPNTDMGIPAPEDKLEQPKIEPPSQYGGSRGWKRWTPTNP